MVSNLIDNDVTQEGSTERALDGVTSLALSPQGQLSLTTAGTYHVVMGWNGAREISVHPFFQGVFDEAGTGPKGYNLEDHPFLIQVDTPHLLRYDPQGNLYFICNNANGQNILRKLTSPGNVNSTISTVAGGGSAAPLPVGDSSQPLPATQVNLGTVTGMDIDSQGNVYLASGTQIYRYDPNASTVSMLYDTASSGTPRTITSIAFDEDDSAIFFTYKEEPKIKKLYLSRLY